MKKTGFTLIEVLAVIIIISVIGAIGLVSLGSFFDNGKSSYYKSVESDILLSANDYFLDNRDILPVTSNFKEVNLNELIDKKYVEEVLNSKGEKCNGKVIVYKENGKYSYDVCLDCGDYKSNGKYCDENAIPKTILITAITSNTNKPYNVTASFDEVEYTNNESVIVSFDMEDVEVSKYEIVNTRTGEQLVCNSFAAGGNKCDKIIDKTGTYSVTSYDKNENILISNQQFNVKILDNGLNYTIDGIDEKYKINVDTCISGSKKATVSFKIKKAKLTDEYKKVEYKLRRNEVDGAYKEIDNLEVTETLESGHYELEVRVTNFVGATTIRNATFNVTYDVNLEYDDGSAGTHEVIKGYAYDYLSKLPTHKSAYGVEDLEIRWYKDDERIYGTTTVEDGCTHKIVGKMSIPVDVPNDWSIYCNTLTYNGGSQTLTKAAPANVTFVNTSGTNAKKYTVSAHINAPMYIWKDGTFVDKTFECEIKQKDITVTASNQKKAYDGTALNADNTCTMEGQITGHTLTCTGNTGTITNVGNKTKTLGTPIIKSGSTDVTSNYNITKVNGTLTITKVPAVLTCANKTYNGSKQTGCSCDGGTLGGDYAATNVGTYTASCSPDKNHTAPSNKTWTISSIECNENYYLNGTSCNKCPNNFPYSDKGSTGIRSCYTNATVKYTGLGGQQCITSERTIYALHDATCGIHYSTLTTGCKNGQSFNDGWDDYGFTNPNNSQNTDRDPVNCKLNDDWTRIDIFSDFQWMVSDWVAVPQAQCKDSGSCSHAGARGKVCYTAKVNDYSFASSGRADNLTSCSTTYFDCNEDSVNHTYYSSCLTAYSCSGGTLSGSRCYYNS